MKTLNSTDKRNFYKDLFMPLKAKAGNNFQVYGFDVETTHKREDFKRKSGKKVVCWKQEFLMGSIYGQDGKEVFWNRKEMAEHLLKRKYMGSMIFATNLEFDFNMLYYDSLEKFSLIYNNGLIAAIRSEKKKERRRKWTFTDTMNYMRCSLAKLAEIVNETKMSHPTTMAKAPGISLYSRHPENEKERKEVIDYNVNDSKITYLFAKKFKDFCAKHNMKMKLTIGSTGMDYWRRNHQQYPMQREKETLVMKHFQGSFKGGMTQTFKRGTYDKKMWYFDYRSAYPAVMTTGTDGKGNYPDPSSSVYKEKGSTELIEHYDGICYAKIKAPYDYIPYLGYKAASGKLLFPYGEFDGWFTHYELRKAMSLGYEVTPGEMIYYHNVIKPFKEAVNYLYKLRKEYKTNKHPFEAMVKVLMNSGLFGKWGTNPNNMEEIIPLKSIEFKNGIPHYKNKPIDNAKIFESIGLFDGFITRKKPTKPFKYSFPIWSEYTTALGRNKLMMDIRKHPKHIVYCDSVTKNTNIIIKNKKGIQVKKIKDLINEKEFETLSHNIKTGITKFMKVKKFIKHKVKKQGYRIWFSNYKNIEVTKDHSLIIKRNKKIINIKPSELQKKDIFIRPIMKTINKQHENKLEVLKWELKGFCLDDGSMSKNKYGKRYYLGIHSGLDCDEILKKYVHPLQKIGIIKSIWVSKTRTGDILVNGLDFIQEQEKIMYEEDKKKISNEVLNLKQWQQRAIIKGMFSADGTVILRNNKPIIRYTSIDDNNILVLETLLILNGIRFNTFKENKPNNYNGKSSNTYSKHIGIYDTEKFRDEIGFMFKRKQGRLLGYKKKQSYGLRVRKIEEFFIDNDVYDLEVPETQNFYANGILVHNTDSAVVTKPVFEEGQNLGDWEQEHELDGGIFIKSKLYMLKLQKQKYICKSKGVGKFMKEKDDFIRTLSTGVVDMERFTKMKESNNIGIKSGSIMNFSKHLSFNDEKRNWKGKDFRIDEWHDSEPLEIDFGT